jgi:polyferredoxin
MCADVVVDLVEDAVVPVQGGQATTQVAPLLTPASSSNKDTAVSTLGLNIKEGACYWTRYANTLVYRAGSFTAAAVLVLDDSGDEQLRVTATSCSCCTHLYQGIFSAGLLEPWWCR